MTETTPVRSGITNPPIVVAVDGSAVSYHAAAWAAADAARRRCPLLLVISTAVPGGFGPGQTISELDAKWLRTDAERVLAEAIRVARASYPGEPAVIDTEVTESPIIPYLIDRSRGARLIVVGSRGLGALRRGLLGSVSTAVVRHAHCPVAVINTDAAFDPVSADKPILVGIDGSEISMAAVDLAFEEAALRDVGIIALHVWSDTSGGDVPMLGWDEMLQASEDAILAESLAGHRERHPDVPVRRVLVRDHPLRALLQESENAQLVVVGSHGRGGFTGMLLGSTSTGLMHSVDTPLIVVRRETA